jgi:phenylacetate-CoA ligase
MREKYNEQGIHVQQCYATADIGIIAYETATDDKIHPGMVINENLIVELLIPGTSLPVTPGEVGELVVTRLHPDYPLIRFATGDLSAQLLEPSPCGRTGMRIKGWMGRADQRAKVRGMFVDPIQLAVVGKNHAPIDRWRLIISRIDDKDAMKLQVTLSKVSSEIPSSQPGHPDHDQWLSDVAHSLQKATNLKGEVQVVDTLPDDGTIVDDQRNYESG